MGHISAMGLGPGGGGGGYFLIEPRGIQGNHQEYNTLDG